MTSQSCSAVQDWHGFAFVVVLEQFMDLKGRTRVRSTLEGRKHARSTQGSEIQKGLLKETFSNVLRLA